MNTDATHRFAAARDLLIRHRADYAAACESFQWPAFDQFNWATDWFDALAEERGEDTALRVVAPDLTAQSRTFAELRRASDQLAHWLLAQDVRRGNAVMVVLDNQPELWELMLATMKIGAVLVPAGTDIPAETVRDRLGRARVRLLVTNEATARGLDELGPVARALVGARLPGWLTVPVADTATVMPPVAEPVRTTDPMMIYFTSGTTARPKMVLHTYGSYPIGHLSSLYYAGLQPGDVHLNLSGPGWAKHSWSSFFVPWSAGATIVAPRVRPSAQDFVRILDNFAVTSVCAPPSMWRAVLAEQLVPVRTLLREATSSGEALNPSVVEEVRKTWGVTIRDGYGQTEITAMIGNTPGQPLIPGTLGRQLPGYRIEIHDPNTGEPGMIGEICIDVNHGAPGLAAGYIDDDGRVTALAHDGWYHTGDLGRRHADGVISFVARRDDLFKARGHLVSPFEVENALITHEAVAEAAVMPIEINGETVPKAILTLTQGRTPSPRLAESIRNHANALLPEHAGIGTITFDDIPKTSSGKISRRQIS